MARGVVPAAVLALVLAPRLAPAQEDPGPVDEAWTVDTGEQLAVPPPPPARPAVGMGAEGDEDQVQVQVQDQVREDGLDVALHGYYRARSHAVGNLMFPLESDPEDRTKTLLFMTQRLRLEPEVSYGGWASLHVTLDCLDNVVWGDNAGLSSAALFAADPSLTGTTGAEVPAVFLRRAWIEANVKFGVLRVGRQPSDWGLGLLSDDGDGFDDDFGDNWYGTTYDRILFATKPIAIGRAIAGLEPGDTPLILAVAWDKLVEDFLPEGYVRDPYDSGWLANDDDDVEEWTAVVAWEQEDLGWFGPHDSIVAGFNFIYRGQETTSSDVYIYDGFLKLRLWDLFLEAELDAIRGSTYAIPLGPEDPETGLYPYKEADILQWLVRTGWTHGMFTVKLEAGHASGDTDPNDTNFSSMAVNPDVNVGLILYEELLAQRTREAWADQEGLWSKGGIYNSYYFMVTGIVEPLPRLQFALAVLTGWPDEVCDSVYQGIMCEDPEAHPWLGTEIDAAVRYRFYDDHVLAVLEGGWLRPNAEAFGLVGPEGEDVLGLVDTDMWTLQSRIAFVY